MKTLKRIWKNIVTDVYYYRFLSLFLDEKFIAERKEYTPFLKARRETKLFKHWDDIFRYQLYLPINSMSQGWRFLSLFDSTKHYVKYAWDIDDVSVIKRQHRIIRKSGLVKSFTPRLVSSCNMIEHQYLLIAGKQSCELTLEYHFSANGHCTFEKTGEKEEVVKKPIYKIVCS